ncbi:efflux RND transporter permease subunit [Eisenibacter elegans]|jgi:multidrug efflux pump subunit AcrB|uniref:efflux RND transporter permease subunit n=1 Tax=Eisenibacter elegans TaxID=997 RepID=UPI0004150D4F|nr:efflux RND transporter permease subunit [Eisenibacter elegans]
MQALGITDELLAQTITQNNQELGTISVKDGQYRYFMKLTAQIRNSEDVRNISFITPGGQVLPLYQFAQVYDTVARAQGLHLFNHQEAVAITIHKQAQAQMPVLMQALEEAVVQFEKDYPQVAFQLTQNQSSLLQAAIGNLQSDLLFGGCFAFLVLFLFMGNYKAPFLIGVILPTSLVMSFLIFYVFGIAINIISLSGLALGLGMTIDNAIIIFDNIAKKRQEGLDLLDSCVEGTAEMIPPLVSSSLTTLAVCWRCWPGCLSTWPCA